MHCVLCDNKKVLKKQATTVKYKQSGLDNVTLQGVEYYKCDQCGEEYFGFGDQEKLNAIIARVLIFKKDPLNGKELRFLRTYLGLSSAMFAMRVGLTKETVSRFENNKFPISKTLDVLVRSLVANKLPDRDYDFHDWWMRQQGKKVKRIILNTDKNGWRLKEAA
ncbi:MAG: YgiT-type zinc finger protein [Deltaproteobacteria bacterium]|nr:YgiT-type zinc finger protein [Deltaproteobacteria bacterium]